jgi:FeS assembly protein IscX
MPALKWNDADEIGYLLNERRPETDPLTVRFTELQREVTELEDFADDPSASTEGALEAIQMAWLEYYREDHP